MDKDVKRGLCKTLKALKKAQADLTALLADGNGPYWLCECGLLFYAEGIGYSNICPGCHNTKTTSISKKIYEDIKNNYEEVKNG